MVYDIDIRRLITLNVVNILIENCLNVKKNIMNMIVFISRLFATFLYLPIPIRY